MRACAFVWVFVLVLVLVSGNWSSDQRMCESFLLPPVSFPFRSLSFSVCPAVVLSSALPFALPPFLPLRFPFLFSPVVELWGRHCLRPCLVYVTVFSVLFPVCVRFRWYKTVVTLLLFSSPPPFPPRQASKQSASWPSDSNSWPPDSGVQGSSLGFRVSPPSDLPTFFLLLDLFSLFDNFYVAVFVLVRPPVSVPCVGS